MKLVEIRDLDGPNIFLLEPAVKVEFALDAADDTPEFKESLTARLRVQSAANHELTVPGLLTSAIEELHRRSGLEPPVVTWKELETPGHEALAFAWTRRRFALALAKLVADVACAGRAIEASDISGLSQLLGTVGPDDAPLILRDADRAMLIVSITGTNGKTTTTRLIAHILRHAGRRVGWSSSSGVFIEGVQVMEGDYTGPSGALRVLNDHSLDVAVLETARGGILLRGIAYESNDVSVFTNVSADHIDLHGVRTVEGLANAKSTVIRITRPDGFSVLNADDLLVVAQAPKTRAKVFFVSQTESNQAVRDHISRGGHALVVDEGMVVFWSGGNRHDLITVTDIPIAFGGSARHMLENALCGAAACLGLGLTITEVRHGMATFTSTPADNLGRLNVYDYCGATVVVDFAHNEAGLRHLLTLAGGLRGTGGSLVAIIGTAGDRTDENLRSIGRIAAESADRVIIKETTKYLRGRSSNAEMNVHYLAGVRAGGKRDCTIQPSELEALKFAIAGSAAGDVIAMMCVEQVQAVHDYLQEVGLPSPLGQAKNV